MKKHLCIVAAAAALTVGGLNIARAQDTAAPADNRNAAEKTGDAVKDAATNTGLRSADQASQEQTKSAEEIHDGPLASAALAQPMRICADESRVCFADAESSAVRVAGLHTEGDVHTLVGTGLFDFGDVDGEGAKVRLQHPQGILRLPDGRFLVVDSYNDALKWLDPATQRVTTWVRGLHEPGGAALGDGVVHVADTNAQRIAIVSLEDGSVETLSLDWGEATA